MTPINDIGQDGYVPGIANSNPNQYIGRDAFAYYLSYYNQDYTNLSGQAFEPNMTGSDLTTRYRNLYNGNIAHMGISLPTVSGANSWAGNGAALSRSITPSLLGNVYHYDQLNRITKHFAFDNYQAPTGAGTGVWQNGGLTLGDANYYESFAYDPNGNITRLTRNAATAPAAGGSTGQVGSGPTMDNMTYRYFTQNITINLQQPGTGSVSIQMLQNNKLYTVNDAINNLAYSADIDDQGSFVSAPSTINTANNYGYDAIGNLVRDDAEEIEEIKWNVTGKIKSIIRATGSKKADLDYGYDASGTRLYKVVKPKQQSGPTAGTRMSQEHWDTTWYIKDPSGNAMATYKTTHQREYDPLPENCKIIKHFSIEEMYIYGSQRHGVLKSDVLLSEIEYDLNLGEYILPDSTFPTQSVSVFTEISSTQFGITDYSQGQFVFTRGFKQYELSNHLGNVLVTIQDRKWGRNDSAGLAFHSKYYLPYVVTVTDYYPFGSTMAERGKSFGGGYKFGFNNQEKEAEVGEYYSFEYRIHDARLGRFLSVDPLAPEYPWNSTYAFAENRVIDGIDLEGLEYVRADGKQTNNPEITEPVFSTGLTEMTGGVMMYIPEGRLIAYVEKSSGHIIKSVYDKSGNFHHYGSVGKKVNSQSNTNGTGEAIKQETSSSNLGVVKDIQPMGIKTSEAEAANFPVTNPIDLSRLRNQNKSGMEKFLAGSIAGYQQGFGIDTKHGAIDRYQYCWGGGNINAQSGGGTDWGYIGNVLGAGGVAYSGLENAVANKYWWMDAKGNYNSTKILERGANGKYVRGVQGLRNGYSSALKAANGYKVAGNVVGGLGLLVTGAQLYNNQITGTEASIDAAFGIIGFIGPIGAGISATYFIGKLGYEYYSGNTLFEKPR